MTSPDRPNDSLPDSAAERSAAAQEFLENLDPDTQERFRTWLIRGNRNCWIRDAYDPPFTALSFHICADVRELTEKILRGNWCLGQAFVLDDICFVNQVNGGDEWLTIKGRTAFESITMQTYDESAEQAAARLAETVAAIRQATEIQCQRLEYDQPYAEATAEDGELMFEKDDDGHEQRVLIARVRHEDSPEAEEECRLRLSGDHGADLRILKNGRARYALSVNHEGDVLLEHFRAFYRADPDATQVARVPADEVAVKLGRNFHDLNPVDQLQRLLPYLRRVEPIRVVEPAKLSRQDLLETWLDLGQAVPWMHLADPPFGPERFTFCRYLEDLVEQLLAEERHAVGTAFAVGDFCCICLCETGEEEWLVIRGRESLGNLPLRVRDGNGELDREGTVAKMNQL